jgi:RhoGAP domain/WD domain, G-beta repeat
MSARGHKHNKKDKDAKEGKGTGSVFTLRNRSGGKNDANDDSPGKIGTKLKRAAKGHGGHQKQRQQTFGAPLEFVMRRQRATHAHLKVPNVVDQCIRACTKHGMDSVNLFSARHDSKEVQKLAKRADHERSFALLGDGPSEEPSDIVALLLLFLRLLPEPLLTFRRFDDWISCANENEPSRRKQKCKNLIETMPHVNAATLRAVCEFSLRVVHNAHVNHTTAAVLSSVLAPILLWPPEPMDCVEYMMLAAPFRHLVSEMITDVEELFAAISDTEDQEVVLEAKLFGHEKSVMMIVALPHLQEVWSICSEGTLVVWDVESRQQLHKMDTGLGRVSFLKAFANDSIVGACSQWGVRTYNARTRALVHELQGFAFCFEEVHDELWVGGEHEIAVWRSDLIDESQADNLDASSLADMTLSDKAGQRTARTKKETSIQVQRNDYVTALCWVPDRNEVWAALTSATLRVYDATKRTLTAKVEGHSRKVNMLLLVEDKVWSAADDCLIMIWSAETHKCERKLEGHTQSVYALASAPPYIWSGSRDTTLLLWNPSDLKSPPLKVENYFSDVVPSIVYIQNTASHTDEVWAASWDKSVAVFKQSADKHRPRGVSARFKV